MFKRHAVVVEKSCDSDWRRRQQAKPACSFFSDDAAQTEIDTGRQTDGENCANKLPRRQTEKDGFPVCTDFFWNFDFYKNRLRFVENLTENLEYEIIFIGKNLAKRRKCYELYTHFIQGNRSPALDRWSGTGEPTNGNPYSLEAAASAARLLLCGNETLLAALGDSTPNSLYFDLHCLRAVLRLMLDNPLYPPEARGTDHGRADTPLHKGPEARRIQDTGISLNSQKELRPDLGRNSFMHRAFHAPAGQSL